MNCFLNSNIEEIKSNSSDVLLWSGSAYNTEMNLSESIYNFREIIIETEDGCVSPISIIRNKTKFFSGYNYYNSSIEATLYTVSVQIYVKSNTVLSINTNYISHLFSGSHPDMSARKVTAIYGRV